MLQSLLVGLIVFLCIFPVAVAQDTLWSESVPVAASSYGSNRPRIVLTKDDVPFVLWANASKQIIYGTRWNGVGFDAPKQLHRLTLKPFLYNWAGTEIAAKDDLIYVTFKTTPDEKGKVYIVKSSDGGSNFSDTIRVENLGTDVSLLPAITVDAQGNPSVAFMRHGPGFTKPEYVVSRSIDSGNTFLPDVPASMPAPGEVCDCCPGSIISDGDRQAVLFRNNDKNKRNIWAAISQDNGTSFLSVKEVDTTNWMLNSCPSTGPDGIFSLNSIVYTWMSQGTVYYGSSNLNGNIQTLKKIDERASGLQNYPRIAGRADTIGIVWNQYQNAVGTANISWSTTGVSGLGKQYDTIAMSADNIIDNPDIAYANGVFHIVYQDYATKQVQYRKLTIANTQTSINDFKNKNTSVHIFPNPSASDVSITTGEESPEQFVFVRTLLGQIVWEGSTSSNWSVIPSGTLPPGVYILETISLKGIVDSQKFVIVK